MLVKIEIKLNNTNEVILNIKYKMIQTSEYKYIEYKDDEVVITQEYEEETSNENLTYEMYKEQVKSSYCIAEKLNLCSIIGITEESITIKMPKYLILLDNIEMDANVFEEKMIKLLNNMYKNKIMHMDLAPRNIGIDKLGDYQLIDLNDIHIFKNDKEFLDSILLSDCEFKNNGYGKGYKKVEKYWKEKLGIKTT